MINHCRTLLLNIAGPHEPNPSLVGDVYIPEFKAITLPTKLQEFYAQLYGTNADYQGKLYRIVQLLGIIRASGYDAYITELDKRLTYNLNETGFEGFIFGPVVTSVGNCGITLSGTWNGAGGGRLLTEWKVTATSTTGVDVVNTTTGVSNSYANVFTTAPLYLTGSTLVFAFNGAELTPGAYWCVRHLSRESDMGNLATTLTTSGKSIIQYLCTGDLTSTTPATSLPEPFKTFYSLFTRHPFVLHKVAGLLLAYIYRLDALRLQ